MTATVPALKTPKTAPEIAVMATMPGGAIILTIAGTVYAAVSTRTGFRFHKQSEQGGEVYSVVVGGGKARSCTCKGCGTYGYACRHMAAVAQLVATW